MREVIPNLLWLGNARDVRDAPAIMAREITAVVTLAMEEPPAPLQREITNCRFPLVDGAGNPPAILTAAVRTIVSFINAKIPTLVACSGGMSRSPAIAAAAIAQVEHIQPDNALLLIAATGPHDVSPALWSEVKRSFKHPQLNLFVIDGTFAICKLSSNSPVPSWATGSDVFSITRTADEMSIVCREVNVPDGVACEPDWNCLRVAGALPFMTVGVLNSLTAPLATAGISIFALSTFDTDYLLVKQFDFARALAVLRSAGHDILNGKETE